MKKQQQEASNNTQRRPGTHYIYLQMRVQELMIKYAVA